MDTVVVLKTIGRICRSYKRCLDGCPLYRICICSNRDEANPELIIAAVEEWRKEHPPKTRQSEFLKMFPNVILGDGLIPIKPCKLEPRMAFICETGSSWSSCLACRRKYWLEEIE